MILGALVLAIASLFPLGCHATQALILNASFTMVGGETRTAHNGKCQLRLQRDGNLIARRRISDSEEYKTAWSTGSMERSDDYTATLDSATGMLQIWKNQVKVYTTVRSADPYNNSGEPPYTLVMDENCVLTILGKEYDNDGTFDVPIWQNIRRSLTNTDVLKRGEILQGFHHLCSCPERQGRDYCVTVPMFIALQEDCNLVQRVGHDWADAGDVVWSPNVARPQADDCYVYVDQDSVGLFEGTFEDVSRNVGHPARPERYWRTDYGNWEETEVHDDNGFYAD